MARRYREGARSFDKTKGLWVGRVDLGTGPDGRRQRKRIYAKTKTELSAKLRQLIRERDEGKLNPGREMTTGEWLDWWADNILPGTVKPSTERQYRQVVRTWIKPNLPPKVALSKLTADHVVDMMRALEAKGRSPTTQAMARTILRRSLRHAERFERVTRNVAAIAEPPKRSGHKVDDSLDEEEANKVMAAAKGDRLEALALVMLTTGARQSELLDLRWTDLDLDAVQPTATIHGTKSRSSARRIALAPFVVTALREHGTRQKVERMAAKSWAEPDLVFTTKTVGTRILGANALRWWHKLTDRAGVRSCRFHASRHTAATLMLNAHVPLEVVSATLGHAGLFITSDIYAKVRPDLQRTAADAMERMFGGKE
jgi:integrase